MRHTHVRHTPFFAAMETLFMFPGRGSTTTSTKLNWPYRGGGRRRRREEGGGRREEGGGRREEGGRGGRRRMRRDKEDVGREGRREDRRSCMSTLMVPKEYDCEESL